MTRLIFTFNPLVTNGLSHPYQLDESTLISRGIRSICSFSFQFSMKILSANRIAPHLGLTCLPVSHKKVARLIWVNTNYQGLKQLIRLYRKQQSQNKNPMCRAEKTTLLLMRTTKSGADQDICCSLLRKYNTSCLYIRNFKIPSSSCNWAVRCESDLFENPVDMFPAWRGEQ